MAMSTYLANAILNLTLRGVAFTAPAKVFVSLHTADPGNTGLNEVTTAAWPSYVRREASGGAAVAEGFAAGANKATTNSKQLLFPAHNGASAINVTHFGIWDAITGGNLLYYDALTTPRSYNPTDEAVLYPNRLTVTVV